MTTPVPDTSDGVWRGRRAQLDTEANDLQRTCGEHADLVIDVARTVFDRFHPLLGFAHRQLVQLEVTTLRSLVPLQMSLQVGRGQCDACSSLGQLRILSMELSGSQAEGLGDLSAEHRLPTALSDHDYMCELGPVHWAGAEGSGGSTDTARLSVVATQNPGFVRLLQERQPGCRHSHPEEFSADSVRRWMCDLMRVCLEPEDVEQLNITGPASSFTTAGLDHCLPRDKDMVPCLLAPSWPAAEFLERSHRCGWPPPDVVESIRKFGTHLVPVGCPGSDSALSEWRLSFSRAEIVVVWLLSQQQRHAVMVLKACRTALGSPGKAVKSYFLKTSLLWLVQRGSAGQWSSIRRGAIAILDFLEEAIGARRLPCFFWADINLLKFTTSNELSAMQRTVGLLRQCLSRQLMRSCAGTIPSPVDHLLEENNRGQPLPERQLRIRLARWLLVNSVRRAVLALNVQETWKLYAPLAAAVPSLSTTDLLRIHHLSFRPVQVVWFQALLLLMPTDRTPGWPRLEAAEDGRFTWDASPLVAAAHRDRSTVHPGATGRCPGLV